MSTPLRFLIALIALVTLVTSFGCYATIGPGPVVVRDRRPVARGVVYVGRPHPGRGNAYGHGRGRRR